MVDCLKYRDTNHFSELVYNYVEQSPDFKSFISDFPKIEAFKSQLEIKANNFNHQNRQVLFEVLQNDYDSIDASQLTLTNIENLKLENTFTITTGHQLNLFTGPLYFFYKIISTINLCEELSETYPEQNFVPMYWMASEDHDFEEINFFNFKRKKVSWTSKQTGPVGEFSTSSIDDLLNQLSQLLGDHKNAEDLLNLFQQAYVGHDNLAEAHFYLVNALFSKYGLVVLKPNHPQLKQCFSGYIKDELLNQTAYKHVLSQSENLKEKGYNIQVNPRKINLFYIENGIRERIVKQDGYFHVLETQLKFSESELLQLIDDHPERFSPNVIMRPLYQEVVLPNLCYIGGGGELAYWLQLKSFFDSQKIAFPLLLLRNSVLLYSDKTAKKIKQLNLNIQDLFLSKADLTEKIVKRESEIDIDFSEQIQFLKQQFSSLYRTALLTDASFEGAVAAQEQKQINGLKHLEKRLLKAQKRKLSDLLNRAMSLQDMLFPNGGLQERHLNFSEVYVDSGEDFIHVLKDQLKPLKGEFTAIELDIYHIEN
ncbi:bacillithiol biosynthesis cysteine-adding enzyme BshC [Psychroflexus sp. ALD_RP9]|uniref:bacillithiol biosynthesis cysteine-adding enzyme BshC n=1 Tax=Psychroflexus sp. ALD_RP9 TaxID=2777186 RepID=UPI001A8E35B9|nr:bacillithiol biosynthesis cysteine-adding enzyme BshC [Psychroflexus sp. ALD_RP9]QSS96469.1 bacillithiol biosynthesis cysteine-adding enzyme BshC [Psychroflexus sp. ALD_RP9]